MLKYEQEETEQWVIDTFLKHLDRKGYKVEFGPEKMERPDFRLFIDDKTIGCELTRITLEELEKWARGMSNKREKIEAEFVNKRTDIWMQDLLFKKREKTAAYWKNCKCDELWLIVHFGVIPLFGHDAHPFHMMQEAIKKIEHNFDKIWFVGIEKDVRQLWPIV